MYSIKYYYKVHYYNSIIFVHVEVSLFDPNSREPVPGVVPKTFTIKVSMLQVSHTHTRTHTRTRTHTHNTQTSVIPLIHYCIGD